MAETGQPRCRRWCLIDGVHLDPDACYRAVSARDARFDGRFYTGVRTTGIYCRPVCPARTPLAANVTFFRDPAAAEAAGFRACRRCRPERAPGVPATPPAYDQVAAAVRLITEGVVDSGGVPELARRMHLSERHLRRLFDTELGVGPLSVARTRRTLLARQLLQETDLTVTEIAFACGFRSLRAFHTAMREAYRVTPGDLRHGADHPTDGFSLRLVTRAPFDGAGVIEHLAARAIPGVEEVVDGTYRRAVDTGDSVAIVSVTPECGGVRMHVHARSPLRVAALVAGVRRVMDLDADPVAVDAVLRADPLLAPLAAERPGGRVPGTWDAPEAVVRAVLNLRSSTPATLIGIGRLARRLGRPVADPKGRLVATLPSLAVLATADLSATGIGVRRRETLRAVAEAVTDGRLQIDAAADGEAVRAGLRAIPGVGTWTAEYVALRGLHDPDAFPVSDLGLRRALDRLGAHLEGRGLSDRADAWRPWRAYAVQRLWTVGGGGGVALGGGLQ